MKKLLLFVLLALLACNYTYAQRKKKSKAYPVYDVPKRPSENERFLQTQWWLGFSAGVNSSVANPDQRFSGFSPLNYDPGVTEKKYEDFGHFSGHAGLLITFYHKGFSFSFQPNYRRQTFGYSNSYEWVDSNDSENSLLLNYDQQQLLDYIEFPVFIKYDLTQTKLRPYVQLGAYYATLVNAQKSVEISGTDFASGNAGPFETQNLILGADDIFIKSSTGVAGGIGASYDFWNIRILLDIVYRMGLNNIANAENRYSENQLASIGDAMDDVTLDNVSISLGCVFPLRFISDNYRSTN